MKKSKKSSEEPQDRLSELPDSLIFEIFGLLPMRAFVQTTILSKRWENLWTTTPYLDFSSFHDGNHSLEFVNRALKLWKGFKILKFKVGSIPLPNRSVFSDIIIDSWVHLAKENGVQELYLELYLDDMDMHDPSDEMYCVPHDLYLCASLEELSLSSCKLQIPENVQWNQLKRLIIFGCILDEHLINQVVSASPLLEDLVLNFSDRDDNLVIQSSSLKHLFIDRLFDNDDDADEPYIATEMRIWSPNLETLHLGGVPYDYYSLMNVSSLTDLSLDFLYEFCEDNFVGEIIWQIFPALQHVEKVEFSDSCIQVLADMEDKYLLSPLLDFKFLTISNSFVEYKEIVDLLQILPKLETLVLQSDYYSWNPDMDATSFLQVERNLPETFLLQLQTVDITYIDGDNVILPFIKILLKHASNLQKMVIRVHGLDPLMPTMSSCLALQQKILRIPISSPTADLIITDN